MSLEFVAGQAFTAADLNRLPPIYVDKTAGESVTSSTTLQNDDHLFYAFAAAREGHTFRVQAVLHVTGAAAGDIKVDWATTGTIVTAKKRQCRGPDVGVADVTASAAYRTSGGHALNAAVTYGCDGTNTSAITEEFVVAITAAGTLTMRWAQNASSGTATAVTADSYLVITPIL
jgi:hypothetical protein